MNDVTTLPTVVKLEMTPELNAMISRGSTYLEVASAYEIADHETAQQAADELTLIKAAIVKLKELKRGFTAHAKAIIENAEKLFDPGIEGYIASENLLKSRLLEYNEKERVRIAAERAKQEAEDRRIRQEAEEKAAALRAQAEAQAQEERRKAAAAELERTVLMAAGNAAAAAALAREVAAANERAEAMLENAHIDVQNVLVAASAQASEPVEQQSRVVGFSVRKNWKAVLMPGVTEEEAKIKILAAAVTRPELLVLFDLNQSKLDKWAKGQEAAMSVPGYVAKNIPIAAGTKR